MSNTGPHITMNPYQNYLQELLNAVGHARQAPLGNLTPPPGVQVLDDAPKILLFSPHPDDECLIGALALRLLRESRWRVVNVAVTQGSNKERQAERLAELRGACQHLQFELVTTGDNGLEHVTPKNRSERYEEWDAKVSVIVKILEQFQPRVILFPHEQDWNGTHIGTHYLVMDALRRLGADFACDCVETEFWGQMQTPNLMVESSANDVADIVAGTSFHAGEVVRNQYHVLLPPLMMDNVRRGSELVGGQGGRAPQMDFATLYRLRHWSGVALHNVYEGGTFLPVGTLAETLFPAR